MFNHFTSQFVYNRWLQPSYFTNFCPFEDPFGQRVKIFLHRSVAIERIPDLAKAPALVFQQFGVFHFFLRRQFEARGSGNRIDGLTVLIVDLRIINNACRV
jgi:hypothetical protein